MISLEKLKIFIFQTPQVTPWPRDSPCGEQNAEDLPRRQFPRCARDLPWASGLLPLRQGTSLELAPFAGSHDRSKLTMSWGMAKKNFPFFFTFLTFPYIFHDKIFSLEKLKIFIFQTPHVTPLPKGPPLWRAEG